MKENKNKVIIGVFLLGVLLLLVGGISIMVNNNDDNNNPKPTPTPTEDISEEEPNLPEEIKAVYNCQKQTNDTTDENTGVKLIVQDSYVFYVTKSNYVQSGGYTVEYKFETLDGLNRQYDYLANEMNLKNGLTIDEANLTITYKNLMVIGGATTFEETYIDDLANNGYTCKNIEG